MGENNNGWCYLHPNKHSLSFESTINDLINISFPNKDEKKKKLWVNLILEQEIETFGDLLEISEKTWDKIGLPGIYILKNKVVTKMETVDSFIKEQQKQQQKKQPQILLHHITPQTQTPTPTPTPQIQTPQQTQQTQQTPKTSPQQVQIEDPTKQDNVASLRRQKMKKRLGVDSVVLDQALVERAVSPPKERISPQQSIHFSTNYGLRQEKKEGRSKDVEEI